MAEEPLTRTETLPVRHAEGSSIPQSYAYYTPEPYQTYHIPRQSGWDSARHSVSHAFSAFGGAIVHPYGQDFPLKNPKSDIRESKTHYYLDVEVPGLESKTNVVLKWLNASTLLLEAATKRLPIPEGDDDKNVVLVVHERKIGTYARAFNFPVAVDQDSTKARLGFGIIRITVPKKGSAAQHEHKTVEVEHAGN